MDNKKRKRKTSKIDENKTEQTPPTKEKKKSINIWKYVCIALIAIILGSGLFVYARLIGIREPAYEAKKEVVDKKQEPTFEVQLKKKQVNQIIGYYLNDFLKDSGVKYSFYLEDQALLNGTFKILGHDMQFYLYFDPFVMENGDVQLKAKSISIGTLSLPLKEIMGYIAKSFDVPDWVEVKPKDQTITMHLSQFKLKNGMYTTADKINLVDDDIRFNVYLPIKEKE